MNITKDDILKISTKEWVAHTMTDIIVDRTPHIVMNPIYHTIATWLLIVGLSFFTLLTLIAYIIRRRNWLDTKFDRRLIVNAFFMILIVIGAVTLYNYKEYERIEEKITYTGTITDVGENYVTLDDGKKGRIFYDSSLKGLKTVPAHRRLDKQSFHKGDSIVIHTTQTYMNKAEIGTLEDYAPDDTYNIDTIKKADN